MEPINKVTSYFLVAVNAPWMTNENETLKNPAELPYFDLISEDENPVLWIYALYEN